MVYTTQCDNEMIMKKKFKKMFKLLQNTLYIGYLPGSALTRCLPMTYKTGVLGKIENIPEHNCYKNKHLQQRKHSA
ncbi:MAG TPA: hypothetical protein DCG52_05095 [Alphaproteobacteria bacterium]|nr:hypothetical protein [Alphaproteobacteria bacterium]